MTIKVRPYQNAIKMLIAIRQLALAEINVTTQTWSSFRLIETTIEVCDTASDCDFDFAICRSVPLIVVVFNCGSARAKSSVDVTWRGSRHRDTLDVFRSPMTTPRDEGFSCDLLILSSIWLRNKDD